MVGGDRRKRCKAVHNRNRDAHLEEEMPDGCAYRNISGHRLREIKSKIYLKQLPIDHHGQLAYGTAIYGTHPSHP